MLWYELIAFAVLSAAADGLSILWHHARESRRYIAVASLSMALEAISWIPIWFAITDQDYRIAVASIVGSALGSSAGLLFVNRQHRNSVV